MKWHAVCNWPIETALSGSQLGTRFSCQQVRGRNFGLLDLNSSGHELSGFRGHVPRHSFIGWLVWWNRLGMKEQLAQWVTTPINCD